MSNSFQLVALKLSDFSELFSMSDEQLQKRDSFRFVADSKPGTPCRVSLRDAEVGESVIAIPFAHLVAPSPYQGSGPIFIRENAVEADLGPNEVPQMLTCRVLSVRGYDSGALMCSAAVVQGTDLKDHIQKVFEDEKIAYIHIHNAGPGCFDCVAERV